jgi:hypothetical protein
MPSNRRLPQLLLAALVLATIAVFLAYPTYTTYDSLYSLLWGRELLHGHTPVFEVYRAPTEHPIAIAFGAFLSLFGDAANRLMVAATLASFVVLAVGLYRLARTAFTPLVGVVAAALLVTRADFPFLAVRAYIDIPYMALVVWAAVLEARAHAAGQFRHARGMLVLVLLAGAGMMRPEAWLLSGLYWLWLAIDRAKPWSYRIGTAAVAAVGPAVWLVTDKLVTGDFLYSLHSTSGLAASLGRSRGASALPHATLAFLKSLDTWPVLLVGALGLALALYLFPRRSAIPVIVLVVGVGTFLVVGLAGFSIIDRYLLVPSLMMMVFAAVAIGGWTMLEDGTRWRRWWSRAAAVVALAGIALALADLHLGHYSSDLSFRRESHRALVAALRDPATKRAIRECGPVSVPTHKLIPDVRWIADLPADRVFARGDPDHVDDVRRGVAIYVLTRTAVFEQAFVVGSDPTRAQIPPRGFHRIATSRYYGVYASCG